MRQRGPAIKQLCRQFGLSLVELMVAMTIGLLLLAGLLSVVTSSSKSYGELNKTSRQLENGRHAVHVLRSEIQHAGFYGGYFNLDDAPATLPDPCSTNQAILESALPLPVQGIDSPATVTLSCLDAADHLDGTDILVVRRASTGAVAPGSLVEHRFYLQGTGEDVVLSADESLFTLEWRNAGAYELAPIYPFETHIYFVSPCSEPSGSSCDGSADGGNPIPTLKRLVLGADGAGAVWTLESIVEGIEDLQLDYGIDSGGDGAPDGGYVTNPGSAANWSNVVTIRANVLARNIEPSAGHKDTKSYTLGESGTVGPRNDAYKRHVYSAVIRVSNPSMRREQ